jgi:hypothetical protein
MRLLRLFLAFSATVAVALELAAPAAPRADATRFAVSVHGTLVKQWTYTRSSTVNGCPTTTTGSGKRTISLRTSDVPLIAGSWSGGSARAHFSGSVPLSGSILQSGTKKTVVKGGTACDTGTHKQTCARVNRSFSAKKSTLVSRKRHRIADSSPGLVPPEFFTSCPGEPTKVRLTGSGIELGDAAYKETTLFSRNTAGVTVQGRADVTTELGGGTGTVVQHVRMTIALRRVGA